MNHNLKKSHAVLFFIFYFYILFFVSLIFSFRFINSISIVFILLTSIILNKIETGRFYNSNLKNFFLISCFLFYLLQFAGLIYTHNPHEGWNNIRIKSSLVAIPLALCCSDYLTEKIRHRLLKWYCIVLFTACLIAIYTAFRNYIATNDSSFFVYHSLVSIYSGHAIQFSILVFIALLYLFENLKRKEFLFNKVFHFFMVIFFLLFLFLLSSKLVIIFFLLYFLYTMIKWFIIKSTASAFMIVLMIVLVAFSAVTFLTRNPISNRFNDILETDFSFLQKEKYSPGDYFNGLQFRLLQWRFVPEILNEKKAWLAGVSPGDAQEYLNQKYISENMYIGTPERGDKGFLGYNTHNQFLEALLQTGLIGLLFFLMVCFALIKMAWQRKNAELSFITILLLAYSFSESVFETQYSLLIFLFFPLFFSLNKNGNLF
jgi:O-antigen ligase